MRVITVVGARPNFVKAAMLTPELERRGHDEFRVHTGQHYDRAMSADQFADLRWEPDVCLAATGFGSMVEQLSRSMSWQVSGDAMFDACVVYGDTTSTLAGAVAAARRGIPVVHVEAGCRSLDRSMPEELNRIATDRLSELRCCPTERTQINLALEHMMGVLTGDLMCDAVHDALDSDGWGLDVDDSVVSPGGYHLATIHRQSNVDDKDRLLDVLNAIERLPLPVIFPAHHRLRKAAHSDRFIDPVPYHEMLALIANAHSVITDSGGVQREAYLLGVPCFTMRDNTEWPETVESGWNTLVTPSTLASAVETRPTGERPPLFGDGHAAERIVDAMEMRL